MARLALEPGSAAYHHPNAPPERELWCAVLQRAFLDLRHQDPNIKRSALEFITGPDFLKVLDMAGIDRAYAADLQAKAQVLIEEPALKRLQVRVNHGPVEVDGQRHTLGEWSRITGIGLSTICRRIKHGWPLDLAVSVPSARRSF